MRGNRRIRARRGLRGLRAGKQALSAAAAILFLAAAPVIRAAPGDEEGWKEAAPGYEYSFPRDHAAHPDYRLEWWYYTGNLETASGRRFGYQLTFFRTGVVRQPKVPSSRWAIRDLYLAHFAISGLASRRFRHAEKINRRGVGWAGAETEMHRVWNETWEARLEDGDHILRARSEIGAIRLRLTPLKPPVIHGEGGISRKGSSEGNASHYYSLTRLRTSGTLELEGEEHEVSGLSWMDHEFGTTFLEEGQIGWDWFGIALEDGRELVVYRFRREDGTRDRYSYAALIDAGGEALVLGADALRLEPQATWRSPETGGVYPIGWRLSFPAWELELEVRAAFPAQELETPRSTGVSYWEGAVEARGTSGTSEVRGRGYLEMTGYAGRSMADVFR